MPYFRFKQKDIKMSNQSLKSMFGEYKTAAIIARVLLKLNWKLLPHFRPCRQIIIAAGDLPGGR